VTNDKANHRRRRGVWLGLLTALLLALCGVGYAVTSSPSASTGPGKDKPSATPTSSVLAPNAPQTSAPSAGSSTSAGPGNAGTGTQVVLAPASSGNGNGSGNCVDPASESANCPHSFGVTVGTAPMLYPGVTRALPVTFSNPNGFDIFVASYLVSVSEPTAQSIACPASSLLVPSGTVTLSPNLKAPKNGSVSTTVPIKLAANAPEGCQQVTFTITVNASAVKK
jgi:hypothetical protein